MGYCTDGDYRKDILNTPHLNFVEVKDTGKTKIYNVEANKWVDGESVPIPLGMIKWYGSWRKYVFYPEPDTLYDDRCLKTIEDFMIQAKEEWKARKVKK